MLRPVVLFQRQPPSPAWVAIAMMGERACAACVMPSTAGRPSVQWIEHLPWADRAASLRHLRRTRALARHATAGVLERGQYQLMATEAPDVPREEWRDALRWRLQEQVDFPIDSASIDLLEIPAHTSQRGRPAVIAVAAARDRLTPLTRDARDARVRWQAFDIVETAMRNLGALGDSPDAHQRGQALLHVGNDYSTLVITAGGELLQTRTIDLSLAQLAGADEATGTDDTPPNEDNAAALAATDRIGLEIQRTLDNVERQFTEVSVARLRVAPGRLDAFIGRLASRVYLPVEPFDLAALLDLEAASLNDQLASAAQEADALVALGAALRMH